MSDCVSPANKRAVNFEEFWLIYLREHTVPANRALHYVAAGAGGLAVTVCVMTANLWYLALGLAASYALGMLSHALIENNSAIVLGRPFWSLACCYRMSFSALTGHLREDLTRAGL